VDVERVHKYHFCVIDGSLQIYVNHLVAANLESALMNYVVAPSKYNSFIRTWSVLDVLLGRVGQAASIGHAGGRRFCSPLQRLLKERMEML
jgi:hypothetical protein